MSCPFWGRNDSWNVALKERFFQNSGQNVFSIKTNGCEANRKVKFGRLKLFCSPHSSICGRLGWWWNRKICEAQNNRKFWEVLKGMIRNYSSFPHRFFLLRRGLSGCRPTADVWKDWLKIRKRWQNTKLNFVNISLHWRCDGHCISCFQNLGRFFRRTDERSDQTVQQNQTNNAVFSYVIWRGEAILQPLWRMNVSWQFLLATRQGYLRLCFQVNDLAAVSLINPVKMHVNENTDVAFNLRQEFIRIRPNREGDREAIISGLVIIVKLWCSWSFAQ